MAQIIDWIEKERCEQCYRRIFAVKISNNQFPTLHSSLKIYAKLYTIYLSDLWWWNTWNSCETSLPTMRNDFGNMLRGRSHAYTFMWSAANVSSAFEKLERIRNQLGFWFGNSTYTFLSVRKINSAGSKYYYVLILAHFVLFQICFVSDEMSIF